LAFTHNIETISSAKYEYSNTLQRDALKRSNRGFYYAKQAIKDLKNTCRIKKKFQLGLQINM
jgi:hypothetical protein